MVTSHLSYSFTINTYTFYMKAVDYAIEKSQSFLEKRLAELFGIPLSKDLCVNLRLQKVDPIKF